MYYDEYWAEPSEFEQQVEEFKNALRNSVKDEIKGKIESLEKELVELKEFKDDRNKLIQEYENKFKELKQELNKQTKIAEESEERWKKARLHQLLGDYLTIGWKVGYTFEYGEKCNKCDDNRKIHFDSPQGRHHVEDCNCAIKYYRYYPQEATLLKMYVGKKVNYNNVNGDFRNRYYTVDEKSDCDLYESANEIYPSSDFNYNDVNLYRAVFLNEQDCIDYCNWRAEKDKE